MALTWPPCRRTGPRSAACWAPASSCAAPATGSAGSPTYWRSTDLEPRDEVGQLVAAEALRGAAAVAGADDVDLLVFDLLLQGADRGLVVVRMRVEQLDRRV